MFHWRMKEEWCPSPDLKHAWSWGNPRTHFREGPSFIRVQSFRISQKFMERPHRITVQFSGLSHGNNPHEEKTSSVYRFSIWNLWDTSLQFSSLKVWFTSTYVPAFTKISWIDSNCALTTYTVLFCRPDRHANCGEKERFPVLNKWLALSNHKHRVRFHSVSTQIRSKTTSRNKSHAS